MQSNDRWGRTRRALQTGPRLRGGLSPRLCFCGQGGRIRIRKSHDAGAPGLEFETWDGFVHCNAIARSFRRGSRRLRHARRAAAALIEPACARQRSFCRPRRRSRSPHLVHACPQHRQIVADGECCSAHLPQPAFRCKLLRHRQRFNWLPAPMAHSPTRFRLSLSAGSPHILTYFVELDNRKGRSAGLSNAAPILAGAAPPPVSGLTAAMRPDGVLLSWAPAPPGSSPVSIRLERKLLTPPAKKPAQGPLAPPPEALEQNLLVESGTPSDRALDTHIRFGESYEYRAQRVIRLTVNGQTLELASALCPPVRIDAENTFPPAVPTGLVAAAVPAANGAPPAIDISWLPVTSADLAGYIVYRRDLAAGVEASAWQRISPAQTDCRPCLARCQCAAWPRLSIRSQLHRAKWT